MKPDSSGFIDIFHEVECLKKNLACLKVSAIEVYRHNGALFGTAATNYKLGVDYSTGDLYYVNSTGEWEIFLVGGSFVLNLLSSSTVDLSGVGSIGDPLIAEVIIDPAVDNQLVDNGNGLYVPPSSPIPDPLLLQVNDVDNINQTVLNLIDSETVTVQDEGDGKVSFHSAFVEEDPLFLLSVAAGIGTGDVSNWNSAFLWGNHALAGYLQSVADGLNLSGTTVRLGGNFINNILIETSTANRTFQIDNKPGGVGSEFRLNSSSARLRANSANTTSTVNVSNAGASTASLIVNHIGNSTTGSILARTEEATMDVSWDAVSPKYNRITLYGGSFFDANILASFISESGTYHFPRTAGTNGQILQINGLGYLNWVTPSTATGTVTSVDASATGALTVTGGPVTGSGTLAIGWTGDNTQQVLGDGTLATRITNNNQLTNGAGYLVPTEYPEATYVETITWTGTTAPSGATSHRYGGQHIYKRMSLDIKLAWATNGTGLTGVAIPIPSSLPQPKLMSGMTMTPGEISYPCTMVLVRVDSGAALSVSRAYIQVNAAGTGFEIKGDFGSSTIGKVFVSIEYPTT